MPLIRLNNKEKKKLWRVRYGPKFRADLILRRVEGNEVHFYPPHSWFCSYNKSHVLSDDVVLKGCVEGRLNPNLEGCTYALQWLPEIDVINNQRLSGACRAVGITYHNVKVGVTHTGGGCCSSDLDGICVDVRYVHKIKKYLGRRWKMDIWNIKGHPLKEYS